MSTYISAPTDIDADTLTNEIYTRIADAFPGWSPAEGNLETIIAESFAVLIGDTQYLLSLALDSIFSFFGASLMQLPQNAATAASVTSTWTAKDTAGYTITAGTQVGLTDVNGDLVAFEVAADVVIPAASSATAAGGVTLIAVEYGTAGNGLGGTPTKIDALSWVSSIVIVGTTAGGADDETDDAYRNRLVARLQLMAPRPILPADFAAMAKTIGTVFRALAINGYNPNHNMLTANQASLETDTTGWAAVTNCTISRSTTKSKDASASLRLSSTAGGDMSATTPTGTGGLAVTPNQQYTASAFAQSAVSARTVEIGLEWYNAAGTFISESLSGVVADETTDFNTAISITANAPATAAFAAVKVYVLATGGASELHYFDELQVREGATATPWVAGGTVPTGNEKTVTVSLMASDGTPIGSIAKADVVALLQAAREANFLVYTVDPSYTTINVTYTVHSLGGIADADLIAAVDAALTDYLNPANWGMTAGGDNTEWSQQTVVRYLELATLINNVGGVDYLSALTINGAATDLTIAGTAPATQVGTLTGTVS